MRFSTLLLLAVSVAVVVAAKEPRATAAECILACVNSYADCLTDADDSDAICKCVNDYVDCLDDDDCDLW
jgi:hypothetical protein